VAAPPYDVVSLEEARQLARDNPLSFLRVSRAELELEDAVDPYSDRVYQHGAANLQGLVERGVMVREPKPILGVYRQRMGEHVQTGVVALASVYEYDQNLIRKHELTRPAKENDRVRLIEAHDSQSGPVFLAYRRRPELDRWLETVTAEPPEIDFTAADGVSHTCWYVRDEAQIAAAVAAFGALPHLYIADGHHRSAAASRVRRRRLEERGEPVDAEGAADPPDRATRPQAWYPEDGFLSVIFPHTDLQILPYNRVVRDLGGRAPAAFLEALSGAYEVVAVERPGQQPAGGFELYLGGEPAASAQAGWYRASPRAGVVPADDPVRRLAVSVLSEQVLEPILGIVDLRTDDRIDFVGGIRGHSALEARVGSGQWAAAFAMPATTMEELLAVADAGRIMPPKSTWFEPKLRDGLFVHMLD
jgi:uncharacterized protein (DUF1015 family)